MGTRLLETTVVGSYPQPAWLIDRERLARRPPPRARARELWRVAPELLAEAQDDATILAIRDMERAGVDVITDGEIRRESYSNRFVNALAGVDVENPGLFVERSGIENEAPRIVGPLQWTGPVELRDLELLRASTDRRVKITVPGPFTMAQQAQDDYYGDERSLALALAGCVNQEVKALFAAGADVVQLDEPYLEARPGRARAYAAEAIGRALEGVRGTTALHVCFGYGHFIKDKPPAYAVIDLLAELPVDQLSLEAAQPGLDPSSLAPLAAKHLVLGVVSNGEERVETPDEVAARIRSALRVFRPERISPAPDCGMKYLPRAVALAKLRALATGTELVRAELVS